MTRGADRPKTQTIIDRVTYPGGGPVRLTRMSPASDAAKSDELPAAVSHTWRRFLEVYEPLRPALYRFCRYLSKPYLARHRRVIAIEEQAHGRTSDRDQPERFESSADDVAALLAQLGVASADVLGFSGAFATCRRRSTPSS